MAHMGHENAQMPSYIVYRDVATGEPFDPTAPLKFFPAKDSDELFDALRVAFPHLRTHSERMRDAIIAYLLEERQEETSLAQTSPAMTVDSMPAISASLGSSDCFNSPDLLDLETPARSYTSSPQVTSLTRQTSVATSSERSPLSLDQMTGVFSVTSTQPKQRVRRKMTEAEKIEYRKRRIVKACDKCAKRKRKCPHNQAEMETVPAKSGSRGTKSSSPRSTKSVSSSAARQVAQLDPSLLDMNQFDFAEFDSNTWMPLDDFNMFDDTFPELDVSQNSFPELHEWDYSTADLNYQSSSMDGTDSFILSDSMLLSQPGAGSEHGEILTLHNGDRQFRSRHATEEMDSPGLDNTIGDATLLANVEASSSNPSLRHGERRENFENGGGSRTMLWEHLRTGQTDKPLPTHTAHVHEAGSTGVHGQTTTKSRLDLPLSLTPLHQTVIQLTGTAKAIKKFTGLIDRQSTPADGRSLPIEAALRAMRSCSTVLSHLQTALYDRDTLGTVHQNSFHGQQTHSALVQESTLRRTVTRPEIADENNTHIKPALHFTPSARGSTSSTLSSARPHGLAQHASDKKSPSTRARAPMPHHRRPEPPSGEGLPVHDDHSLDLYMARKRISSNLNLFVGKNMNVQRRHPRHLASSDDTNMPLAAARIRTCGAEKAAAVGMLRKPLPGDNENAVRAEIQAACHAASIPRAADVVVASDRLSDHVRYRDHHGRPTPQEDRLRDYFKVKDHHGRAASSFLAFAVLLYLGLSLFSSVVPSLLLLACIAPAGRVEKAVQCTTKNSAWLCGMYRGGTGTEAEGRDGGWWLTGLMYPAAHAPLRFAGA